MRRTVLGLGSILFVLAAVGCAPEVGNDGDVVGGACVVNDECAPESQCRTGEDWPMGLCAKLCASDADCPDGSVCTGDGNFCLVACESDADCRADDGYTCAPREVRGGPPGDVMVCATAD